MLRGLLRIPYLLLNHGAFLDWPHYGWPLWVVCALSHNRLGKLIRYSSRIIEAFGRMCVRELG